MSGGRVLDASELTIVRRAARELRAGTLANLGIGLPTFIPEHLPPGLDVLFHSENGFVGMGRARPGGTPDDDVIDAGGRACTVVPGAAFFDSALSFAIVRGGRLDLAVLGAFEVSARGDLANWKIPGRHTPGMGGAMELAAKARSVLVVSRHADRRGRPKLVERCTLPLTARECVDTLVTERAVFRRRDGRLRLASLAPGCSVEETVAGLPAGMEPCGDLEPWP